MSVPRTIASLPKEGNIIVDFCNRECWASPVSCGLSDITFTMTSRVPIWIVLLVSVIVMFEFVKRYFVVKNQKLPWCTFAAKM